MPRRKRSKPTTIIPHLRDPSSSNSLLKRKKKAKHVTITSNAYSGSSCCHKINRFIASIMKHFVIPTFAFSVFGCIVTSCYLNLYLQTEWLHKLQIVFHITNNGLYATLLSYILTILCILFAIALYSYLYLIIALLLSPKGHDVHSYEVGRGKFDPYRVFAFIYTCCQTFQTLSYFNSYFFEISSCLAQCKRISSYADLSKMDYASYSLHVFKRIISMSNNRVLEAIEMHQKEERNYLKQAHYDEIVKQNTDHILKCAQCKPQHMISVFNVHYDKNDPQQYANIFLPPSLSLSLNYILSKDKDKNHHNFYKKGAKHHNFYKKHMIPPTPAIIFLVGGAWGSCDISFSASVASSFVASKIALIYPTYRVYPDGDIQDMVSNINAIVEWVIKYASVLNINPNHLAIVGQSAGAHLGALSVLKAHQQKSPWLRRVRLFCGLSGPYCINDHYRWESSRGVENLSPMGRCMKGIHNFAFYSPPTIAQEAFVMLSTKYMDDANQLQRELKQIKKELPHFLLIHSANDYVVPVSSSRKFYRCLKKLNVECELAEYEDGTHYDSLFGLCDVNNCLFNRLITDISSRLFICCRKYNETRLLSASSSSSSLGVTQKQEDDVQETVDSEIVIRDTSDIKIEEADEEEEEKKVTEEVTTESTSADVENQENENITHHTAESDRNEINENEIAESEDNSDTVEQVENIENDNDVCEEIEEFYEEVKEETVHVKPRSIHLQQIASSVSGKEAKLLHKSSEKLAIAQTISVGERIQRKIEIENKNSNTVENEDEVDTNHDDTNELKNHETNMSLFKYKDVSIDPNKSDEALEFMKNLLLDMDKALDAVTSFNQTTLQ